MNRLVHSLSCVREAACRLQPAVSGLQYNLRFASTLKKRRRAERPAISKKGKTATSLQKGKVTQTKVIRRKGEYLYGAAPCLSALSMNRRKIHAIYLRSGISVKSSKRVGIDDVHRIAEKRKLSVHVVDKSVLERMSGKRPHQGVIFDVEPLNFKRMEPSDCQISEAKQAHKPVWLVLDEIHDPMNLGAILRCAFYFEVDRVITSAKKCCTLTPTVSKASSGAMELMPVHSVKSIEQLLQEAKKSGWDVLGTTCSEDEYHHNLLHKTEKNISKKKPLLDCRDYVKKGATILILGNEGFGIHKEVEKACSAMLTVVPQRSLPEQLDSLNVAVATGILLHCLQNNR